MGCASSLPVTEEGDFHRSFRVGPLLDATESSQLRSCTRRAEGTLFSVVVRSAHAYDGALAETSKQDLAAWRAAGQHPNIAKLAATFNDREDASRSMRYFVVESCERSLLQHLRQPERVTEPFIMQALADLFRAVARLHELRILHGEISPASFAAKGSTVKLCDLSPATRLAHGSLAVGSPLVTMTSFTPPEFVAGLGHGFPGDVWSLAVIAYVLCFGRFPGSPKEVLEGSFQPSYQRWSEDLPAKVRVSGKAQAFVRKALVVSAPRRPTAAEALAKLPLVEDADASVWPCLRPLLKGAVLAGAFEGSVTGGDAEMSRFLEEKQSSQYSRTLRDSYCRCEGAFNPPSDPRPWRPSSEDGQGIREWPSKRQRCVTGRYYSSEASTIYKESARSSPYGSSDKEPELQESTESAGKDSAAASSAGSSRNTESL